MVFSAARGRSYEILGRRQRDDTPGLDLVAPCHRSVDTNLREPCCTEDFAKSWTKVELTAAFLAKIGLSQNHLQNFSAVVVTVVVLWTKGRRLLSVQLPSDVTFAQRRGWVDNTYFMVFQNRGRLVEIRLL